MIPTPKRLEKPEPSQLLGRLAMAVTTSLLQIALGTILGYWVDSWLGWMLFTPIGVCLGMALATKTLLGFMKQITLQVAPGATPSAESLDYPSVSQESGDSREPVDSRHSRK
ncbi:MAG: AtpZ/AtpI family protein [Planctomycetota bacterium]|nr:AtpZ/AtpI family protein [Planctomycetota bacterium]